MNFITDLSSSLNKDTAFNSILVVVNRFIKYIKYIAVNKIITAEELTVMFKKHIITVFESPDEIVSNRGSVFIFYFWSALCFYLKIHRKLSTAFYPQTDGQTE